MSAFERFHSAHIAVDGAHIFARWSGEGPPLLLLHGFPQTHLMWRHVAPLLAAQFTVVCADLRGYGRSACPPSAPDHAPYSKRALARDMVQAMGQLGFGRFALAGHDRGGRAAYRLALDYPERVERLAVLDIVPTAAAWGKADARFALAYWPWALLAQAEPLPERLVAGAPEAVVDAALAGWGSPAAVFEARARADYIGGLRDPARVHAICEEYRASATLDRAHDDEDRRNGRRIACAVYVLWASAGPLDTWYEKAGGPLALWRPWCHRLDGRAVEGGHFFPEANPVETARLLAAFFSGGAGVDPAAGRSTRE